LGPFLPQASSHFQNSPLGKDLEWRGTGNLDPLLPQGWPSLPEQLPSRSCLYPTSKLQGAEMASQRYIFVASHTFLLLFPLAISWDALFLVFCFLLSCSDSSFLFFVGAYHQSMVNVGAAKIVSSKVKARVINTNSWLLQLFSLS
jgi:hypothetical protein